MWRFVGEGIEPIPGIPLVASDAEFEAAVSSYESLSSDRVVRAADGKVIEVVPAAGSVKASGLYEHFEALHPPLKGGATAGALREAAALSGKPPEGEG